MILAEPLRPSRPKRNDALAHALPRLKLDPVALAVVEADGLDAAEALERPGETDGRILAAGKQDERGFGAGCIHDRIPRDCAEGA